MVDIRRDGIIDLCDLCRSNKSTFLIEGDDDDDNSSLAAPYIYLSRRIRTLAHGE